MNTATRYAYWGLLLLLPLSSRAENLPPPGGPYPSTVNNGTTTGQSHPQAEQLRFPPPDLVAPAPPPPSLKEELGADFGDNSPTSTTSGNTSVPGQGGGYSGEGGFAGTASPASLPPLQESYRQPPSTGSVQGWPGYPVQGNPPAAGRESPPAGNYPGYSYPGYGYPGYGYGYSTPSYGYGYPGSGYAPNTRWDDTMQTPFGSMPTPWDSMPKSFFPGR